MIGKITKGSEFAGLTQYILGKETAQLLCTNLAGSTPQEFWQQLETTKLLNADVLYPVCHASISFAIEDTAKLNNDILLTVADTARKGMNIDNSLYFAATHSDRKHFHLHIAASRIDIEGNCVSDWRNFYHLEKTLRTLEEKLELKKVNCSWEVERTAPSTGQERRKRREKEEWEKGLRQTPPEPSAVEKTQNAIARHIAPEKNLSQLFADLKNHNIFPRFALNSSGQILGISYLTDGVAVKGSKLGRNKGACTLAGLTRRGIIIDLEPDRESISGMPLRLRLETPADTQVSQVTKTEQIDLTNLELYRTLQTTIPSTNTTNYQDSTEYRHIESDRNPDRTLQTTIPSINTTNCQDSTEYRHIESDRNPDRALQTTIPFTNTTNYQDSSEYKHLTETSMQKQPSSRDLLVQEEQKTLINSIDKSRNFSAEHQDSPSLQKELDGETSELIEWEQQLHFRKRWEQVHQERKALYNQEPTVPKQEEQEEQERHQTMGEKVASVAVKLLDYYQTDSLQSNNNRYQIDRFSDTGDIVVQRADTIEPVPNYTQILAFNCSKEGQKLWHNLMSQKDFEHFQNIDRHFLNQQQQIQQRVFGTQQETVPNYSIAEAIVPIAGAALDNVRQTSGQPESVINWNQYRISWHRQELELSITAFDGRGEILRAAFEGDGTYQLPTCSVTPDDLKNFQHLRQELQGKFQQKVPKIQRTHDNQLQQQLSRHKQAELD